jgi:hypothetical protein
LCRPEVVSQATCHPRSLLRECCLQSSLLFLPTAVEQTFDFAMSIIRLLLYTLVHLSSCANTCYYPNGSPSADKPCDPNALFTQCCGSASNCLSNGLCLAEVNNFVGNETVGTQYARGTCTDKTWVSSLCPQQCLLNQDTARDRSAYNFRAGGVQVWQCTGQGFAAEAKYCCESQREQQGCCQTQSAVFALQGAMSGPSTTNTLGQTATASITSKSVSTIASAATASATASETRQPQETNKANTIGIGAGVGVGVGLIILVAGIIFVVRKHKLKKRNCKIDETSVSELCGTASSKQPVEVWTQPAEMWTQPQELPAESRLAWEMSGNSQIPRPA